MKKQNYINKFIKVPLAFIAVLGVFTLTLPTMSALAAGTCYTSTGYLQVEPTTKTCATDPQGRISYKNFAGAVVQPTDATACYAGETVGTPGTSFVGTSYTQQNCSDLEALRKAGIEAKCGASGGTWGPQQSDANSARGTITCNCTGGLTYTNYICQTSTAGSNPNPSDDNTSPTPESSTCDIGDAAKSDANGCCLANDLNGENCGIIKYVNIAFNFVSGGVTLAIIGNIIFAGIQYSTAQGDPSAVGKSKKRLRDAVIAFLMFLSLYGFIQWLIPGGVF